MNNILYLHLTHHKCASKSIGNIFRLTMDTLGIKNASITHPIIDPTKCVNEGGYGGISYRLAEPQILQSLENYNYKGFHVFRDPRDIIISGYYSHKNTHPTEGWSNLENHRKRLQQLNIDDGLIEEMNFDITQSTLNIYAEWNFSNPNIYEVQFSEYTSNPIGVMTDIYQFLGLLDLDKQHQKPVERYNIIASRNKLLRLLRIRHKRLSLASFKACVNQQSFESLTAGRKKGEEDQSSHYRKGQSGEWKLYFKNKHKDYFKSQWPGLLARMGYEQDDAW